MSLETGCALLGILQTNKNITLPNFSPVLSLIQTVGMIYTLNFMSTEHSTICSN